MIDPDRGPDQNLRAFSPVIRFDPDPENPFAIMDLTPAYAPRADSVQRGCKLIDRKNALIEDEIESKKPAEVWWFMHTQKSSALSDDGRTVTLSKLGKKVIVRLLSPADAKFILMPAAPLPTSPHPAQTLMKEAPTKLAIHLTGVTDVRIAVELIPITAADSAKASASVVPLASW